MKFKGTLKSFRLDMGRYRKRLHEHLCEEITQAAFLWLNAVLSEIPVWSGASHATFLHLARSVGYQLAVQPTVASRVAYGQQHGEGEMAVDAEQGLYSFHYQTSLRHLLHNEFNTPESDPNVFYRLKKPGPYHFQEKGRKVFEEYARQVRLPNPWKSLKVKAHKVS